jgi:hypothetical protein
MLESGSRSTRKPPTIDPPMKSLAPLLLSAVLLVVPTAAQHAKTPAATPQENHSAPLPDAHELIARATADQDRTFEARENYLCQLHSQEDDLDSHGNVKKIKREDDEEFFINGHQIDHTITKDGQPLSESAARKEQERVDKDVKKYSDPSQRQKEKSEEQKRIGSVLRIMEFKNERREVVDGRSTIVFDISGNPSANTTDIEDRFVQAMQGTLRLDEATGEIIDLNIHSMKDVKIAGGLVASLHKGFWLHLHQSQHKDGVWLPDLAEGSGDARAALFLHPYFRFHQTQGDCRLYGVSTTQVIKSPASK